MATASPCCITNCVNNIVRTEWRGHCNSSPCVTVSRAPTTKWLLFIHTEDVWSQYGELKAKVTSVFGSICLEEWFHKKVKLLITQRQKGGSWSNSKASWALQMSCLPAGSAQLARHCGCYMWRRGDSAADWRDTEGP